MISKGRNAQPKGSRHGMSKLSDADVRRIRALRGKRRQADIAVSFGISQSEVSDIQTGKRWRHVTGL